MSTNKKFRIQNGVDVKGELTVNDVVIIRADGTIVAGAIADAVSSLVDAGALTGSGSSIVDSDSQIFIDVNSNTVAIASETASRISDIANLQTQIDSLGVNSDTQAAVDSLQTQIDSILGASPETLDTLVEIVSAFEGADSDIQSLLAANSSQLTANTSQIASVAGDLAVETSRRISGDTALENSLNAEIARATSADDLNAAAITAEAIARQADVASLQASQFTYNDSDGWTGNLIPSADNEYALGSPDRVWKDLYIGPGSLYINGTKILEDNSGTITMYADAGQNLSFGATGGGNIDLNAGDESVQLKSDLVMSVGETISTVGGEPTKFGGAVDMGTNKVKNVGAPVDPSDAATKEYVDSLEAQGTISGDKVFEDNVTIEGNLTVEGTTTTLDSQTLKVADNIIDLNSNVSTGAPVLNAGIRIMRGDEPAVQLRWNELDDRWEVYDGVTATPIAVTSTDVIAEGDDKLFFTVVRARDAVSQDIADAVAAEATARGAAIDAEIARATSAEQANAAAIAAETTAREEAVTAEETARIAGDATVQASVDAEQAARIAADLSEAQTRAAAVSDLQAQLNTVTGSDLSSIQDQLDAIVGTSPETLDTIQEVVAAFEGADSDIQSLITGNSATIASVNASLTQEVANRAFFDTAEATARENADEALQASIDAEESARIAGDSDLTASLASETAAREAADTAEATARADAISAEATARVAGDATVQAAVDAEAARATAAEQANATAISAEETRALAAEASLQNKIDQVEAGGAQHPLFSTLSDLPDASANHGMFAHVHAEGAAFFAHGGQWVRLANLSDLDGVDLSSIQSQIDDIVGTSPANLDTLQEIVSLFENADSDLQTLLTTNSSAIASIQSDVTDLQVAVSDTAGADAALQQEVDARIAAVSSEATSRIAGDADLAADILEEKTQRIAQASIETTARMSSDSALQAQIDAEESARLAGDASLQTFINTQSSNLSDETTQRIGADGLLQNQIDDIVADNAARTASGATVAELNAVEDALDAEVVRAQLAEQANASAIVTGDAALQAQLDAIIGTSPETLDTLQEIVSAYESADNSLQNLIDTNTGTLAALQTTIGAENVPLITPDIGETITYEVEYAGRQFYAVSDDRNVYVYDSARSNPRIPVATIYNQGYSVNRIDANSEAIFVDWSQDSTRIDRYEFANLVLGISSPTKHYSPTGSNSISSFAVSEDYIYAHDNSYNNIWKQSLLESGSNGRVGEVGLSSIDYFKMRVFGDKLYALRTSGADTLWVWDIDATDGSLSNAHQLTSSDLNSDQISWATGELTGSFEASSTLIAVGAPLDDTQGNNQGSVYLFNPDNLNEAHTKLYAPAEYASDGLRFGYSIALTDTRLIVGALSNSSGSTTDQGYIFIYDSTNLILPPLVVEAPDALGHGWFPYAIHEESNRLIVRPYYEDYGLFVYDLTNMDQDPLNLFEPTNSTSHGTFGTRMAITPAATVSQTITDTIIPAQGLGNSINYLESKRQELRADLEANLAAIQSNDADIASIAADVATNTANIATNAAAIVAVDADRTAFEASVNADRQSHRDAVQADIDAFTTTVNTSQAEFISDHDSDYTSFTSSVESAFATTNELQDEIRTRMGVGHVALPQDTTSITYDREIPDQYYMVRRGDNETYVYSSANWSSTGQNVGVGTRIEFPDEYTTDGATNNMIVTRDYAIFLVNKANVSGEHSFLVYDLETFNVSSTPIAVVDCGGFDRNLEYDGSTKLMVTKYQNDSGSSLGGVRVYDIPSLAAGNAIYVESMVDDLPSSLGITASDPSNVHVAYGNLADWNSTHVFVTSEAQQKVIVYNKSDLSFVTTLSDTVYNGADFADVSLRASDTMVVVTTRRGDIHWSNGYGKVAVFDATDLSIPPVIITDNNLVRHYSSSHPNNYYYYAFYNQSHIAVHDDYLFLGNTGHSQSGTNGRVYIVPKDIALQGDSVLPQNGSNSAGLISWSDTTWGHQSNDTDARYSHEISVHGDLFVVNAHAYRQHSFNNTNMTMIHDINDLTLAPVKVEEIDDGSNSYSRTYVSPRATITESYTETFNPNDSLTSAVNYLNAKKEELLTAVGALTGSTSFVEDVQAIEDNIDFKLAAQDQRFDSDKAEQVAIYAQANLDQSAVYAAANAEQASIYDSANAAHVAYFEQYTDGETAAREASDTTLQTNIDTEEAARIAGDSDLQSQIDAILGASPDHLDTMVEIVSAFENADSDISNLLSTNATNNAVNATAISALESSVEAIASATEVDLDAKVPFVFVKKPEANTVLAYNGNNLNLSPIELTPNRESGETVDADMGYGVDVAVSSTKVVVAASNGEFFVYDATDLFAAPTIVNSGVTSGDFGSSIVMTDDVIAISSVSDGSYGTVKLYDASSYALLSTLEPTEGSSGMGYGKSMAIRGTTLVVSSPEQNKTVGSMDRVGFLYIYDITNPSSTSLVATLNGPDRSSGVIGGSLTINDRWIATTMSDRAVVWDRLNLSESPKVFGTGGLEPTLTQGGLWGKQISTQGAEWVSGFPMPLSGATVFSNQINLGDQGNYYSYQFVGYFKAPETADFIFRLNADTYGVLWVGEQALTASSRNATRANLYETNGMGSVAISMVEGEFYPILMTHHETSGNAYFQFTWKGGAQTDYTYDLAQNFYYNTDEADFSPLHLPTRSIEPIILEDNKMYVGSYNGVSIWNDISTVNTTDYTDWKQAVAADSHVVAPNNEDQFGVAIGLMSGFLFVGSNSQSISVFEVANLDNPPNVKLIDSVSSNIESVPAELAPPVQEGLLTTADSTIGAINEVHNELDAEVTRATGVESVLRTDLDANTATINTNIVDIANETSARISGDSDLQAQIDNIVGTSPETLDTIQEVVSAFQNADNDIQTLISNNSTEILSLQNEIGGGAGLTNLPNVMTEISRTVYQDQYMIVSGNANGGSVYVFDANNPSEQPVKLMHPNGASNSGFGHSVCVAREYLVVGAPYDDEVSTYQGAVFVYELADLTVPPVRLQPNTTTEDYMYFGQDVVGTESFIIVGCPFDDYTGGQSETNSGSVYLFDINNLTLSPTVLEPTNAQMEYEGYSSNSSNDNNTLFGYRLEVIDNVLFVGSKNYAYLNYAYAQRYTGDGQSWHHSSRDRTGYIGLVSTYDLTNLLNTGSNVSAMHFDALNYENSNAYGGSNYYEDITRGFGEYGITMSSSHLFVGMPYDDYDPDWYDTSQPSAYRGRNNGLIAIFPRSGEYQINDSVRFIRTPDYQNSQNFGWSLASDETYLYVGVPHDNNAYGLAAGQVLVYDLESLYDNANQNGSYAPSPVFTLNAPDGAASDYFGYKISVNGGKLAVAAPYDDDQGSNSGSVYIYQTNLLSGVPIKISPSDLVDQDTLSQESIFGYNELNLTIASGAVQISDHVLPNSGISTGMNYLEHRANQLEQLANDVNINAYNYANNISVAQEGYGVGIADNAAAIATETTARADGDAAQQVEIDSLTSTTASLTTQLNDEITRAVLADSDLNERVDILSSALQADSDGDIKVEGLATFTDGIAVGSSGGAIGHDPLSDAITILSDLDMNEHQVLNIAEPTVDKDVTTKLYVDTQVSEEETRATTAETDLQAQIDHIVGTSPETLDTFQEIVSTLQGSDSDLLALMTSNATGVGGLNASLTTETANRESADTVLQSNIDTEEASRIAGDSDLQSQIDSNDADISNLDSDVGAVSSLATTATTVVGSINEVHSELDAEVTRATAAESAETTRATDAEAVLQSNINTESSARIVGDASLQSQIDGLSNTQIADKGGLEVSLATEVARATLAEGALQSAIDAEELRATTAEGVNAAAVVTEQTRAEAVEAGLAADIAVETARATAAEVQLANHLGANFTDGSITVDGLATFNGGLYFGDGTGTIGFNADVDNLQVLSNLDLMGNRIINYPTPVDSGDVTTKGYVDATTQAVSDRVDAILQGAGESLDTIVEVVAAFENADSDIQSLITSNSTSVTANTDAINAEVAARQQAILDEASARRNADSDLSAGLSNETSRALSAEGVLTSDLAAEVARATSAETGLAADIAAEASRATAAEGVNAQAIADETTRATTVEASLAQDIADETLRAQGAEAVLTSDVSANATAIENEATARANADSDESALRVAADAVLTADLASEVARAQAAESAETSARVAADSDLQTQIDFIKENTDPAALDSLTELVSAFENADSDVTSMVASNASAIAATNARTAGISVDSDSNVELSVGIEMAQNNIRGVNDIYAARAFVDTVESNDLKVQTGTADFEGSYVNFGSATVFGSGIDNRIKTEFDNHINVSTANSGEFVKWNGTDYEWVELLSGRLATDQLQVDAGGSIEFTGPGGTLDVQNAIVHFGGSDVRMPTPTDAGQGANKGYVDAGDSDLTAALAAETAARTLADTEEATQRNAADAALQYELQSNIDDEVAARIAAVDAEAQQRNAADSSLQNQIDIIVGTSPETLDTLQEIVTAFENADSTLTGAVAQNSTAITAETTRATAAESGLQSAIDALDSDKTADISDEVARATAAEGVLTTNLANEESRATTAEGVLTTNLTNEISRATSAEAALASDISAEETRALAAEAAEAGARADADSDLQSAIDAEVARATAAEAVNTQSVVDEATARTTADTTLQSNIDTVSGRVDAILNGSSESLDTIVEVVAAFENADSDLQTLISSNAGSHTANAAAITAEEVRALAAEGVLQSAIDAEETRATGVESSLQSQITSEIAARSAADQSMKDDLDSDIAVEAALRAAGDASLQSGLDVEVARATAAEGVLQSLLDSEQSARILSGQGLQSAITVEENARIAADAVLQSAIDAEELARTSADNALQANINAVDAAVTAITNGSPETLNQLIEVVAAFEDADSDLQTLISNLGGDASLLTGRVSTLENEMNATELATTSNANAISAETLARVAAVQVNADAITAESTARAAAITAEQNARAAAIVASESDRDSADASLQAQITALATTESNSKSSLQFLLSQEVADRIAGDSDLTDSLAAEVARATAAESALSTDISDEASARATADASLQTQINNILSNTDATALNSLAEIVTEFQSVDGTLTGLINSNGSRITALESSVGIIEAWNTDNVSEGVTNKYFTDERVKACLTGGLCIDYNSTTGEISVDEVEAASSLTVAESHDANALGGQAPTYYRINVYDAAGNLVN